MLIKYLIVVSLIIQNTDGTEYKEMSFLYDYSMKIENMISTLN